MARRGLTWDEETIAMHDKERGTRGKIVEPNTPFHRYDEEEDTIVDATEAEGEAVSATEMASRRRKEREEMLEKQTNALAENWGELQSKLEQHVQRKSSPSSSDATPQKKKKSSKDFKAKRRAHYNEYQVMKQMRGKMGAQIDDEEEEEEEEEEKPSGKRK